MKRPERILPVAPNQSGAVAQTFPSAESRVSEPAPPRIFQGLPNGKPALREDRRNVPKRRGLQIGRWHRLSLCAVGLSLFFSGGGWAWIQHLDQAGRASDTLLQIKTELIAVHGFIAMFFVLWLGTLLDSHVSHAWHARKNRPNGAFFLAAVGLLTLSGYALYYLGSDSLRAADGRLHLWLGVAAPPLLLWHIWSGRKAVRAMKSPTEIPCGQKSSSSLSSKTLKIEDEAEKEIPISQTRSNGPWPAVPPAEFLAPNPRPPPRCARE